MNSADQQSAHTQGAEQKTFFETSFYRMNFSNILAAPKISDEQRAAYGQTVTDHFFRWAIWTAGSTALLKTARLDALNSKL